MAVHDGRARSGTSAIREHPVVIVLPVFNDWEPLKLLLARVAEVLQANGLRARIIVLDDASTIPVDIALPTQTPGAIAELRVVALRRNLGHQRAIAIGLAYVHDEFPESTTLIMDADGEDDPADIPRLLDACVRYNNERIVFAERTRRSETFLFQIGYRLYRGLHLLLTGVPVKVGNYSVLPFACLRRLVVVSELWSHYAAAVFQSRVPFATVPTVRAPRLGGESSMRFVSLVVHGLTAISVFGDIVGVRLLLATLTLLVAGVISVVLMLATGSSFAMSGWIPVTAALLVVVVLQTLVTATMLVFVVLAGRQGPGFIPVRDYRYFIQGVRHV